MADLRFALRILGRAPLLTLVIVLSLALGIGANTAIFSFLHQIVLRSLPTENPEELVVLNSPPDFKGGRQSSNDSGGMEAIFSYKVFRGLERQPQGVTAVAGFRHLQANLSYRNQTVDGSAMVVSGAYFETLAVKPRIGRLISREDDVHGAGRPVVVLSHAYWQSRLGGQPEVLNQPLRINGRVFTIVGITPRGFTGNTFGSQPDVFVPLSFKPAMTPGWDGTDQWNDYWLYLFARLKPGVSRPQAAAALNATYRGLVEEQAQAAGQMWDARKLAQFRASKLTLIEGRQGHSSSREETKTPILILLASTGLVLLIAIANTANVLLARSAQRRQELAIRTALGASRMRLMRQVLTEAMLLSLAGGAAGLLFAYWTIKFLIFALTGGGNMPEDLTANLQWPVLSFALAVSAVCGLLCGLYPAWEAARSSVSGVLKDQSGRSSGTLRSARIRNALVCGQVTVSALLLIPTGLFMKSLVNLTRVDLGMDTRNVITFRISPELNGYKPVQSRAIFERAEAELAAIPGVRNVSATLVPLISGSNWGNNVTVEGYSRDPKAETHSMFNMVGSGFFGKMGVPLLNGREFTDRDTLAGPKAAIVNEQFARHFFGKQNPIGRRFGMGGGPDVKLDLEIVGVVKDSHYSGVKQKPPRLYFVPWRQSDEIGSMSFYVRTALAPEAVMAQVRKTLHGIDPDLPLEELRTFEEQVSRNIRMDRLILQLSAVFSILATLLAMLGLYGVMAYSVTRRTREIGIRIALGAATGSIRGMVMRQLLIILAIGLALGVPAALALSRFAESLLFGVKSFDGTVVAGAVAALIVAALLAGFLPARRATRISPTVALRYE
ncbi:MAG TPA: ABC transporter permease [Bryobacteraceae bacterium]|nr:ABC transporter permease [Bryobacteraceae bacterium]